MSTHAKIAANKSNAAKSTGPNDTRLTRYNALKTGLTARGLSPMDDVAAFNASLRQLRRRFKPSGPLENFLVKCIALGMVRRNRGERLEAAYLDADLAGYHDSLQSLMNADISKPLTPETITDLCNLSGRYETAAARRLQADVQLLITLQRERG